MEGTGKGKGNQSIGAELSAALATFFNKDQNSYYGRPVTKQAPAITVKSGNPSSTPLSSDSATGDDLVPPLAKRHCAAPSAPSAPSIPGPVTRSVSARAKADGSSGIEKAVNLPPPCSEMMEKVFKALMEESKTSAIPLVSDRSEFDELMTGVSERYLTNSELATQLLLFRVIKRDAAYAVPLSEFSNFLKNGSINESHHIGEITGNYGRGLINSGNLCFMNSAMQALSLHLKDSMKLRELNNTEFPVDSANLKGGDLEKIPAGIRKEMLDNNVSTQLYVNFHNAFLTLIKALDNADTTAEDLLSKQIAFVQCYRTLGVACKHPITNMIFRNSSQASSILPVTKQEDPDEFLNDIFAMIDLNSDREFALIESGRVILARGGQSKCSHTLDGIDVSATLRLEIPEGIVNLSLQDCLNSHLRINALEGYKWSSDEIRRAGLDAREVGQSGSGFTSHRQSQVMSSDLQPPSRVIIQAKLFSASLTNPTGSKLVGAGCDLLRFFDHDVVIPFYASEEARSRFNKPNVSQKYRVEGIICHQGETIKSGHYVTLRRKDTDLVLFNDDKVSVVGKFDQSTGMIDWGKSQDLMDIIKNNFTGFLFFLGTHHP